MLKRYTLNEEMAKMKHLMLFEAGQPQQQAADPMASYTTTMMNWGQTLANMQQQYANSPNNADARAIQVALSAAAQGNPRMMDQAIRMASNPNVRKQLQGYKSAYGTYAKAYQKYNGSKPQNGVNAAAGSALANAGATQDYNQRLRAQTNSAETQNDQAWNNLQAAKSTYTTDMDNQVAGAQSAQNAYYGANSFTLPGVKTYDGQKVVTQDVQVKYDPQRKGYYYQSGADGKTRTWLTNDQVKGLSGNTGYTNYVNGAADAYRAAYQPSQSAQQNYDNALAAYNSASTNYQSALTTPMVNTWSPQTQQVQRQQVQPQQQVQQPQVYSQQQTQGYGQQQPQTQTYAQRQQQGQTNNQVQTGTT